MINNRESLMNTLAELHRFGYSEEINDQIREGKNTQRIIQKFISDYNSIKTIYRNKSSILSNTSILEEIDKRINVVTVIDRKIRNGEELTLDEQKYNPDNLASIFIQSVIDFLAEFIEQIEKEIEFIKKKLNYK